MKEDIYNELESISPFLANLKKQNSSHEELKAPPLYFETLTDKIIQEAQKQEAPAVANSHAITQQPIPQQTMPPFWQTIRLWIEALIQPRYAVGFAMALVLLTTGWWLFNNKNTHTIITDNAEIAQVSHDEIHNYIHDNIDDFDEELFLNSPDLVDTEGVSHEININDEDIEKYLEENIDEKDLKDLESKL